jgi:adenylosuccinate synthase
MINGITEIALTKLDILDEFDEIKIAVRYNVNGVSTDILPVNNLNDSDIKIEYVTAKG